MTEDDWEERAYWADHFGVEPEDDWGRLEQIKSILDTREHVTSRSERKGVKRALMKIPAHNDDAVHPVHCKQCGTVFTIDANPEEEE